MIKKIKSYVLDHFNDEVWMFKFTTGLKFILITTGFTFSVILFTYLILKIDLIYFVANGYPGASEFQEAFYAYITSSLDDMIVYFVLAIFFIFALGFYLSTIMLRPFKVISDFCESRMENKEKYYSPDYLSDLKLLTSFSVFFFSRIDEAKLKGRLEKIEIPVEYTRIHKPIFEKNFFFNYFFIIIIFALLTSLGIFVLNNTIREQVFQISGNFTSHYALGTKTFRFFIEEQFQVADIAVKFFIWLHVLMYCLLGAHLYGKVSGPSFAVFATMRSFLKGNYHNRIHLIGHYYLRDDCRKINKYLDHIQKTLPLD